MKPPRDITVFADITTMYIAKGGGGPTLGALPYACPPPRPPLQCDWPNLLPLDLEIDLLDMAAWPALAAPMVVPPSAEPGLCKPHTDAASADHKVARCNVADTCVPTGPVLMVDRVASWVMKVATADMEYGPTLGSGVR